MVQKSNSLTEKIVARISRLYILYFPSSVVTIWPTYFCRSWDQADKVRFSEQTICIRAFPCLRLTPLDYQTATTKLRSTATEKLCTSLTVVSYASLTISSSPIWASYCLCIQSRPPPSREDTPFSARRRFLGDGIGATWKGTATVGRTKHAASCAHCAIGLHDNYNQLNEDTVNADRITCIASTP